MYHVHSIIAPTLTLNPPFWVSGTAYPGMQLHIMNTSIFFYVLVWLTLCQTAVVHSSLCYVTSGSMYTFVWTGITAVARGRFIYS